jgi:hypothetical protein
VFYARLPPVALIFKHAVAENFFQFFGLFISENVLFGLPARAFVAVGNVRFKSASLPPSFTDPGVAL